MDNSTTHVSFQAWDIAKKAGLFLIGLPANTTSITQVLDVNVNKYVLCFSCCCAIRRAGLLC